LLPRRSNGSRAFNLKVAGSIISIGAPLTFVRPYINRYSKYNDLPFPALTVATAIAFLFLPKV
jgi:hypothetical protein